MLAHSLVENIWLRHVPEMQERIGWDATTGFARRIYTEVRNFGMKAGPEDNGMPIVTYVSASGVPRQIDLPAGMSVMQGALNHRVEGIPGECSSNCVCATCHVYVDAAFLERLPAATQNEKFMLSIAAEGPRDRRAG